MKIAIKNVEFQRNISIDIIRGLAIIFVLYNHLYTYEVSFLKTDSIFLFIFYQLCALICRCGPPLFFMISGALLLGKEESYLHILRHRVLRIVLVMLLCAFIKCINGLSFRDYLHMVFFDLNWYLYAYLAYLLMLPFLRLIAINSKREHVIIYLISCSVFYLSCGIFYFFNTEIMIYDLVSLFNERWASQCWGIVFPLLGYYVYRADDYDLKNSKLTSWFILFMTIFSVVVCFILTDIDIKNNEAFHVDMMRQHFILFPSILIFSLCLKINNLKNIIITKTIVSISNTVFGIFMLETHSGLRGRLLQFKYFTNIYSCISNQYVQAVFLLVAELIMYFIIISILKKIPLLKRIL